MKVGPEVKEPLAAPPCRELTNRQRVFVLEYVKSWNATAAAKLAGYSEKTAYSQGGRLLKNVEVRAGIAEALKTRAMGSDEVLARLSDHARTDMADFLRIETQEREGQAPRITVVLDLKQAEERGKLHLVKKLRYIMGEPAIELYDSQAALVQLGRHLQLFTDGIDLSGQLLLRRYEGVVLEDV